MKFAILAFALFAVVFVVSCEEIPVVKQEWGPNGELVNSETPQEVVEENVPFVDNEPVQSFTGADGSVIKISQQP